MREFLFPIGENCNGYCCNISKSLQERATEWKTPQFPIPQISTTSEVHACLVFDVKGVGQTINQQFYLEVLTRLREKYPELWQIGDWFQHNENASAHSALRM